MKKTFLGTGLLLAAASAASAAPPVNDDYVRSLASPGKTVLVMEYYDGAGKVVARKGYASEAGFKAISGTEFRVDEKTTVRLYGLQPCEGEMVNKRDGYAGSCQDFATDTLAVQLKNPQVLLCRAFITEQGGERQNATCYGYYNIPGALNSVDMLEEQLVSLGAVTIAKKPDGTLERPDLADALRIGKEGKYGMWADPRISGK